MSAGVVIVTHYRLGEEFLQALRLIVPEGPRFHAVSVDPKQSVDEMRTAIQQALAAADQGDVKETISAISRPESGVVTIETKSSPAGKTLKGH